jgi:acyl-CoA synthetase (AMP-forming)/AMP-acid ligase II
VGLVGVGLGWWYAGIVGRMFRLPEIGLRATVPELLRYASSEYGDADFVVMMDRRLSFVQADRYSAVLAKRLLAAGVGKGTRVGIALPSSTEFVVAFLACARVGAVASLFSTLYRPVELQRALELADVQILIAPRSLFGRDYAGLLEEAVPGLVSAVSPLRLGVLPYLRSVWLDESAPGAAAAGVEREWATAVRVHPRDAVSDQGAGGGDLGGVTDELLAAVEAAVFPADLLSMIWTSGSAADPKGVLHTHGVAVRKMSPKVGLGLPNSRPGRVLSLGPMFWVAGPQSILGALSVGSTMLCQERFEPAEAIELIERERCTFVLGWVTMQDRLRSHPDWQKRDTSSLAPLVPAPVSSKGDPRNGGMTETFGLHGDRGLFDYKIVDHDTGVVLGDSVEGEFCVRGFGLMAGMYKREREEILDSDGFYHTGDRGYIEDGQIYFTGRYSELIKTAGANVSPAEVEAVLVGMPELRQAVVFGIPSEQRGEDVVAVVVPEPGVTVDVRAVQEYCNRVLSSYKVPSRIYIRDMHDIPVLGTGKIDKRTIRRGFVEQPPSI